MAVKRRTIWLADEDWAYLLRCAKDRDMNPSQLVHALLPAERVIATFDLTDHSPKLVPGVLPHVTFERELTPFNSRPFTPVPKVQPKRHG